MFKNKDKKITLFLLFIGIIAILAINMTSIVTAATNSNDTENKLSQNYTISYFDKTVGGDVLKNPVVLKNVPNTTLSGKIINMSKNGSVILKFGKGNPKVLIYAGIHGDEIASNIATLRLIESLKNKKIKGSIYIIPFAMPKSTAKNTRFWYSGGKKHAPNRIANVYGTPAYKIIKFAKKNKIKYIIEVHSGGFISHYKRGLIYVNPKPVSKKETQWIKYIKKNLNPKIKYGTAPRGYVRGYAKVNKISSLTFEVERDKGNISSWADVELKMLISGLKYFRLF